MQGVIRLTKGGVKAELLRFNQLHFLNGAFVGQNARPLCRCLYIFYARVLIVYEYSSSGQAVFYKSIARVKGDVSVN